MGSTPWGKANSNVARGECDLDSVLRPRHTMKSWASAVWLAQVSPEARTRSSMLKLPITIE